MVYLQRSCHPKLLRGSGTKIGCYFENSPKWFSWTLQRIPRRKNVLYTTCALKQTQVLLPRHLFRCLPSTTHTLLSPSHPYRIHSSGEGAVALRAYVPNEQGWICSLLHTVRALVDNCDVVVGLHVGSGFNVGLSLSLYFLWFCLCFCR